MPRRSSRPRRSRSRSRSSSPRRPTTAELVARVSHIKDMLHGIDVRRAQKRSPPKRKKVRAARTLEQVARYFTAPNTSGISLLASIRVVMPKSLEFANVVLTRSPSANGYYEIRGDAYGDRSEASLVTQRVEVGAHELIMQRHLQSMLGARYVEADL